MAKMILAVDRIKKAREMVQKARDIPLPHELGRYDISYMAEVKDVMRKARDLIKFIPDTPTATPEMKAEVKTLLEEIAGTERELLRGK